jgi:hypothetical protein
MELEPARVETAPGTLESQGHYAPDDRERIIQSCYELVCAGRPLTEILGEAKRLSDLTKAQDFHTAGEATNAEISGASKEAAAHNDLRSMLQTPSTAGVQGQWGVRLRRLAATAPLWLLTAICTAALATTAGVAVVAHLPGTTERTSAVDTASTATRMPAISTSSEAVLAAAERRPVASASQAAAEAPTPMSDVFDDVARPHPLPDTSEPGAAQSTATARQRMRPRVSVTPPRHAAPPVMAGAESADYHDVIPNPYDSVHDRMMRDHFRTATATDFYYPRDSKSVRRGTLPYRMRVGDSVLQYDGLIGRYVQLPVQARRWLLPPSRDHGVRSKLGLARS